MEEANPAATEGTQRCWDTYDHMGLGCAQGMKDIEANMEDERY